MEFRPLSLPSHSIQLEECSQPRKIVPQIGPEILCSTDKLIRVFLLIMAGFQIWPLNEVNIVWQEICLLDRLTVIRQEGFRVVEYRSNLLPSSTAPKHANKDSTF